MEPEAGIMLVWPLAAMEAQALGWSQIQPAHLLCAILKFAEMDGADLERLGQTNENLGNLAQEHQDLKAHLDDPWGITVPEVSTRLRRALRRPGEACPERSRRGRDDKKQPCHCERSVAISLISKSSKQITTSSNSS